MKRVFNFRIIPLILLGIILGICAVTYFERALIIACVVAVLILAVCAIFVKQMKRARGKLIATLLAFCFALGITSLNFDAAERREIYEHGAVITARIDVFSESSPEGYMVIDDGAAVYLENLTVNGIEYDGKAEAVFADKSILEGCKIGDIIKFEGDVTPLIFDVSDSYSVADYTDGIYYHVYAYKSEDFKEVVFENFGNDATLADKIKLGIKTVLFANVKGDTAGFLYAMTFGDKAELSTQIKDSFSYTGTAHIFAVSGLHVGIIAGAVVFLLKKMRVRNSTAVFFIVAAILLPFCALCEFSPSTVRATVMVLFSLASKIFMARSDAMTNFAAAGSLLLIINPFFLFDLGFLMSFSAVFGLITLSRPLKSLLTKIKCPRALAEVLSASISANIALMPILLVYFGGQSLIFVIANLLIIPLISFIFPIYLAVVFIVAAMSFAGFLLSAACAPFTLMIFVIQKLSTVDFLIVDFEIGKVFIILNFMFILVLSRFILIPGKAKKITAGITCAAFCIGLFSNLNLHFEGQTYLHFFKDDSGCQMMIIDDTVRGSYLVVNGDVDYAAAKLVRDVLRQKHVGSLDGVFVVGDCGEEEICDIMFYANCSTLYSFSANDYLYSGYDLQTIAMGEDYMLGYYYRGLLEIILGEVNIKVLADGYSLSKADDAYDILVCYDSVGDMEEGRYAVCDDGYVNSLKNYMPSAFTIVIKDGKINTNGFGS